MRSLILIAAAGLLLMPAPKLWADSPAAGPPKVDSRQEMAKNAEIRGDIARARQEYASAEVWYGVALQYHRHNSNLYNKLGIAQIKQGEMNDARGSLTYAVRSDRKNVEALNNLGVVYYLQRKYKPAVKYLKQALALDEQRAVSHLNLAEAWMAQKQVERAMAEYSRALELDADILSSTTSEGVNAQVVTPEQRALINYLIAKSYAKRGNVERSLEFLSRARELHYRSLASVYIDQEFAPLWTDARLQTIVPRPAPVNR